MIVRQIVICLLLTVFLLTVAEAQQPKKIPRIGYLYSGGQASDSSRAEDIRLALRKLGYVEGQNIATEYRYAEGKRDRLTLQLIWYAFSLILSWQRQVKPRSGHS
jgi:putative ABC transport system substrate-binding protein